MSHLLDRRYFTPGAVIFYLAVGFGGFHLAREVNDAFDRTPPVEYLSRTTSERVVHRGGTFHISYLLKRTRLCTSESSRIIEDVNGVRTPVEQSGTPSSKTLGLHREERTVTIPNTSAIAVGPARYWVQFTSYCSALQRIFGMPIIFESPVVRLNVVEKDASAEKGPSDEREVSNKLFFKWPIRGANGCPPDRPHRVRGHIRDIDGTQMTIGPYCRS